MRSKGVNDSFATSKDRLVLSRHAIPTHAIIRQLTPMLGQGVQRIGMATPWLEAFPSTCKPFLEEMDAQLQTPLSRIIAEGPNSALNATENSQPAIMATSIMILRVLEREFGFRTAEKVRNARTFWVGKQDYRN